MEKCFPEWTARYHYGKKVDLQSILELVKPEPLKQNICMLIQGSNLELQQVQLQYFKWRA